MHHQGGATSSAGPMHAHCRVCCLAASCLRPRTPCQLLCLCANLTCEACLAKRGVGGVAAMSGGHCAAAETQMLHTAPRSTLPRRPATSGLLRPTACRRLTRAGCSVRLAALLACPVRHLAVQHPPGTSTVCARGHTRARRCCMCGSHVFSSPPFPFPACWQRCAPSAYSAATLLAAGCLPRRRHRPVVSRQTLCLSGPGGRPPLRPGRPSRSAPLATAGPARPPDSGRRLPLGCGTDCRICRPRSACCVWVQAFMKSVCVLQLCVCQRQCHESLRCTQ